MKSLDDLIRHLLEEIALCGDYGARVPDFIYYVNEYYYPTPTADDQSPSYAHRALSVDRKLLEKIWEWLARHPETEVGENGWADKLSLSEVERRSAPTEKQQSEARDDAPSTPQQHRDGSAAPSSARKGSNISGLGSSDRPRESLPGPGPAVIRIYANVQRRWQAITGHAPDPIKIPRLDFACLSIIAACRGHGILQPDLVTVSGQDKRSVPERTTRLHEAGYISKTPSITKSGHTSKLTHMKFVKNPLQREDGTGPPNDRDDILPSAKNPTDTPVDFLPLQHKIFDILREVKLITFNELKKKLGTTGLPWPMRLFASHLRRLENLGCVKQVRARPDIEAPTPFLFRCVKYVRDPEGKEWLPMQFPSRNRSKDAGPEETKPNAPSDDERIYQAEEAQYLARHVGGQPLHNLREIERPFPQWSGDGTLSNLLYDLVHTSGRKGMSTMELKNRSVGCFNLRPTENHLSRLVEMWQMSQPLHLRHLAIIRDAALTDGIPHYVHYSFENFQQMVDEGKASWESVMTITKEHKDFKDIASIEAKPEVDENGFPKLPSSLFQGRHNDASLTECIRDAGALPLPRSSIDPKAVKSRDGTWCVQTGSRVPYALKSKAQPKGPSAQTHVGEMPQSRMKRPRQPKGKPNLLVTNAGRPRKFPRGGLPPQDNGVNQRGPARLYKKSKLLKEIEKQVDEGRDRYETTAAVLNLAIVQYRHAEQEPPWEIMEEVRLAALVPCLLALEASKSLPTLNTATRNKKQTFTVSDFRPSAVGHGQPLRAIELQVVEDTLRLRIRTLDMIPIDETIKRSTTRILTQATQSSAQAKGASPQFLQKKLLGKPSKRQRKSKPQIVDDLNSNSAMASTPPNLTSLSARSRIVRGGLAGLPTYTGGIPEQYVPSVAAHTWLVTSSKLATEAAYQPNPVKRKYKRKEKNIQYLPSVAAHTWPVASQGLATKGNVPSKRKLDSAGPEQTKRRYNRKKKPAVQFELPLTFVQPESLNRVIMNLPTRTGSMAHRYLPSIAAHTSPIKSPKPMTEATIPSRRKLGPVEPAQNKRQKKASWKKAELDLGVDVDPSTPAPRSGQRPGIQTYEQQLGNIFRPTVGCYVGKLASLAKPGKRGAKPKSRLAVFRSRRIQSLACLSTRIGINGATTESPDQGLPVLNPHSVATTGHIDTANPTIAGPYTEDSFAPVVQPIPHPPLPVFHTGAVQQCQGKEDSKQQLLVSPEQYHTKPMSPRPLQPALHSLPDAPRHIAHDTGAKRKRSVDDEARREAVSPPPTRMAQHHTISSAYDNVRTVAEQVGPTGRNPLASPMTDVHPPSPGQDAQTSASTRGTSESRTEHPLSILAPINLNASESHAVQPEAEQGQDDGRLSLGLLARPRIPSADGGQPTEDDIESNDRLFTQQQQAADTCIPKVQAIVDVAPKILPATLGRNSQGDPVPVDHETVMHDLLEDTALLHGREADGNSVLLPNTTSESPQPRQADQQIAGRSHPEAESNPPDQPVQGLHVATSEASPPQVVVDDSTEPKGRKGVQKMRPQGGSIAAQRRKIVMDIIERCGGIYPGTPELGVPFKEQWTKSGYPGRAETSTLSKVVKYLCDTDKLRQVLFVFKDYRGLHVTKIMITKVEITTTDPRVKAMQDKIQSVHPSWHFPDKVGFSNEVCDTYGNPKGPMKNRTAKDLEVDEERVQLPQKPGYLERYEIKEKARQERVAHEDKQAAVLRTIMAEGDFPDRETISGRSILGSLETPSDRRRLLYLAKKHNVDRLASLKKAPVKHGRNNNEERFLPARRKSFRHSAQASMTNDTSKRIQGVQKIPLPRSGNSVTFTRTLRVEDFDNDYENQMLEEQLHFEAIKRIIATNEAEGITYESGLPLSGLPETRTFKQSENGLSAVPDPDLALTELARRRKSQGSQIHTKPHSRAARQQMYTIMEPEHLFHPATGTFSVNFSPYRTEKQIMEIYHWQTPPVKDFHDLVDDSERWELRKKGLEDARFPIWIFIDFLFFHAHQTPPLDRDKHFTRSRCLKGAKLRGHGQISGQIHAQETPDHQILAELAAAQSSASTANNQSRRESSSSGRSAEPPCVAAPRSSVIPAKRKKSVPFKPFKTRRLTTIDKLSLFARPKPLGDTSGGAERDRRRVKIPDMRRGERLTADFTQRILTAVIVIRTLTGGLERHIDWILVTKAFGGEYDPLYLSKIWPKALQSHKVQAEMIRTGFEQLFLKAYENGLVPPIDYDNLELYDWAWLIDWTIEHLDTPLEAALDLPLQRDRIDQVFDFKVGEDPGMSAYYEFCTGSARVKRRETELHKKAWVHSLTRKHAEASATSRKDLDIVKTWVRANIATKRNASQSRPAADKLSRFDETIREQALSELHRESVVMQLNKGRLMPGCSYDLSQKYLKPLKKKIETGHLHHAAMFKREIDRILASKGEMIVPKTADDAFILAIQNMQAHRKISFVAKNPPMEKFGLGGVGNYRGRQIPKSKYLFDVELQATDDYQEGNPLLPLPEPPSVAQTEADKEKIPLWYDIHGDVIGELWGMAVAAIISILITRPGVSIYEVEPLVRPSLGSWEVQMMLDWMVEAKAARKLGDSYVPGEWWWLCLDTGRTFEDDQKLREEEKRREKEGLSKEEQWREQDAREAIGGKGGGEGGNQDDVQMQDD